jgi:hypothetical protein
MNIKDTGASKKIQKELMEYQDYWEKAKGGKPDVIRVTSDQLNKLGVKVGFHFYGSKLELLK